jgi:two-component system chemotaxis response regulator CheB
MSIKVLIVDDSFFMRRLISDVLGSDPDIEVVGAVADAEEARKAIPRTRPDCITLDLVLPGEDGLSLLNHIMAEHPTPVVILSAYSKAGADITMQCLDAGAAGFVLKPSGELSLDIEDIGPQLIREVKAAAGLSVTEIRHLAAAAVQPKDRSRAFGNAAKVVVVGASTGGPQTLRVLLSSLPANFPGVIIVAQHMPMAVFTEHLANRLSRQCELVVDVLRDEEILRSGRIYFVPGGTEMTLSAGPEETGEHELPIVPGQAEVAARLRPAKKGELSPSIDATMMTAAHTFGPRTVGIILSGIGHDGTAGMRAIQAAGGHTIAQDASALINGMPTAVIEAGFADQVLPVEEMALALRDIAP